ncbi:MAG: T9SS type A sorting domain-containing protein [Lewinellaceae bacterium]|nr:T9SS type A sorting domain-containing protein [Lewinellaceae bacterium]
MMNKKLSIISSLVLGLLCLAGMVTAQNHPYNTGSQAVYNVPAVGFLTYYDAGGPGGNYPTNHNNINTSIRFQPTTAGAKVQAVFTQFATETSFDALYVWDGPTTGSPKIASANGAPVVNNFWGTGGFWSSANNPAAAPSNVAPGTVRATAANASGALTFGFVSDGSVQYAGWTAQVSEFIPCNPVPNPVNLALSVDQGTCSATATLNVPTFNPGGCGNAAGYTVCYALDADPYTCLSQPYPAQVVVSGIPSGMHTITWQVRSASGSVLGEAVQNLDVADNEAPTFTNCPSDLIINLDPGLCCAIVSWADPMATDNCPFIGPVTSLLQTCTYTNYWTGYALDLQNLTGDNMIVNGVQIQAGLAGAAAGNYNLRVYMRTGPQSGTVGSPAGWTECANTTINVTAGFPTNLYFDIPFNVTNFTIPGGGTSGIYVVANNGANTLVRVVANVFNTTPTTDGNLSINQNPSTWVNGLFGGPAFNENPRPWLRVDYQIGGDAEVIQTGGPLSGDELCKDDSPWTVTYEVADVAGNVATCEFNIEVLEYANPVTKLSCNDNVQISLDDDCITEVGADDILEGGPYGCYDDYEVTIFNANNTPLASSPNVGRQQIGGPWKVKVTDPETGNSCWGLITVEDKLAPVMVCTDLTLDCGADIPAEPTPFFFQAFPPLEQNVAFTNYWTGYMTNLVNKTADAINVTGINVQASLAGAAAGTYNLRAYMRVGTFVGNTGSANGWVEVANEDVSITAGFPTVLTYDLIFGAPFSIAGNGTAGLYVVANNGSGTTVRVVATLSNAPTEDANLRIDQNPGRWINNLFGGEAFPNENPRPQLHVYYETQQAPIPVTDNCDPGNPLTVANGGLSFGDDITNYTCAEDAQFAQLIVRTWTATDDWGNSTQCTQNIRIRRPTIGGLAIPPNYDDLDQASLDCKDAYPTPDVTGEPGGGGCGSLQFDYWDKVLNVCQGSYTIIRTWTINDMCTGEVATHNQVIKVMDKTPPSLTCPDEHDIKFGNTNQIGYQDCTLRVRLPWIQVEDDCSTSNNTTLYVWTTDNDGNVIIVSNMDSEGYFNFDLPVGFDYTFTYTAIDDCGNKGECSVEVEVEDNQGPVVICESFHVVALTDSVTLVNAESFDDGSYDECTMITFDVRRGTMNASGSFVQHPCNQPGDFLYAPQVRFYCCDAQSPVALFVDLRVRDAFGNANNCMVEVDVVDKIRPTIWCPEDITVQWGMPYEPTEKDTLHVSTKPATQISAIWPKTYLVPIQIEGMPVDADITDLDISLDITHEALNQLQVTLWNPYGTKATVIPFNSCNGGYPQNINATFNDEAYDIITFNQTGQKVPAPYTCTVALPSVGSYNQGQMRSAGDYLKAFDGDGINNLNDKDKCFNAQGIEINAATNRISNFQVSLFIANNGLSAGDRIFLQYASASGQPLGGLSVGEYYLFEVINANTLEFLTMLGSDITSVPAGTHMFCAVGTWFLQVTDNAALAGGVINDVTLHIEYVTPTGLKPHVSDNTEACGLDVTWQDLGTPEKCGDNTFINRRWRVEDQFGNNTQCLQRVYFNDDTPLVVQFPCDVTINCENLDDLDATGDVIHNGDCELVGIEHIDHVLVTTDACYKILRQWIVKDWCKYSADGNVDYNSSSIDVNGDAIQFTTAINALINARKLGEGDRVTLKYITSGSVEIGGLVEGDVYSAVYEGGTRFRIDYNTTKQQTVNITSEGTGPHIFRYANSSLGLPLTCDVITEWYPFTDWHGLCPSPQGCRAWEDDGDGYYTFTQEIKVVDNEAPQWVDCSNKDFCSFEEDCEPTEIELVCPAVDNCTDSADLVYQYFIDAFNDGTVDITGVGFDASGAYPNGTHKITFKVSDQCGNFNTCTKLFTISDCKKPTPICHAVSIELMPSTGMAEVWATSLEVGDSYDNCTEYGDLQILVERVSDLGAGQDAPDADAAGSVVVSCDDLPPNTMSPVVEVAVWVGDEAGNWDYCVTTITVQDWMGACGGTMNAELSSSISNEDLEPIELVNVELTGTNGTQSATSGNSGVVSFNVFQAGQYTIAPQKDINPLNGVSTYDLLLMQKHLLGIKSLTSPYKLIAADVNNNCNISISDIIELRKLILAPNGANFSNNTSWRFVDGGYTFPNPNKPCNFMETKMFDVQGSGLNSASFVAVKIGDVSGDHTPNSLLGTETRNSVGTLTFGIADQQLVAGQEYTVAITAENFTGVQGYQYTMEFASDMIEFVDVTANWSDLSASNFGRALVAEGTLTTSWNGAEPTTLADGEVLYTVTFRAVANGQLSQALKVNSRVTVAEAYDANEELLDVQFRFDGGLVIGGGFELYQNEPNPFRDVTVIGFNLPEASTATLKVYDVTGKVMKVVVGDYAKGYNAITLTRAEIEGNGMLYYQLETPTDSATKRMITVE